MNPKYYLLIAALNTLDLLGIVAAKFFSLNKNPILLAATTLCFAGAGYFFAKSLQYQGAAITNILWIAISVLLVTAVGYFLFKQRITPVQFTGIVLILVGLILININQK